MNHSHFSDGPRQVHPHDNSPYSAHPSDAYSEVGVTHSTAPAPAATAPKAADPVDWPETRELRSLLQCGDASCRCHRPNGNVHCPACADKSPSLSVDDDDDDKENASAGGEKSVKPLWHCHAGCPQDAVTKALHKVVFEGENPLNAATFNNGGAANAAPKTLKTLRQRGIGPETRRHFELKEYATFGVIYPTFWSGGAQGPVRIKAADANQPRYRWRDQKPDGENEGANPGDPAEVVLPTVYNADVIHNSKRMQFGLFIARSESEVWTMQEAGLASICSLAPNRNPEALVQFLRRARIGKVQAIFGNDVEGRQLALRLREVCEATNTDEFKVVAEIRLVDGGLGFDLGALFALVKFNAKKFRDEIEQMSFAPRQLLDAWRENPEAGLPETATEGATANGSNIGVDGLFRCLDEADLQALPLPECLVEGVVLEGRPTIFYGLFGTGKSLIALDMALSVSQNMPWCGRETKPGMAFFVAGEGANGLKKRVAAWKQHNGVKSTPLFRVIPHPVILSDPAQCRSLIKTIKCETQATGTPAALVVIDTLALSLRETGDENSAGEMTLFLKAAESICLSTGAAVLILHHPNRQGDARGSTALPSNSDGFLAFEGKTSSEVVKLNPSKVRDMGENGGIKLRRVVITLDDMLDSKGKPVTSAVFVPVPKGEENEDDMPENESPKRAKSNPFGKPAKPKGELSEKEQATWQALLTLNANGAAGVTSGEWAAKAKELGVSGATFERAKKKLQDLSKVERENVGKGGARFTPRI